MDVLIKKNNAVVFGLTSDQIFAVACVIMDLKKLNPGLVDEVVIFHDGINQKDQDLINDILPTKFIVYDFPIQDLSIFNQSTINYFSKMVFSKFECLRLLNYYKNVLWLDYDIVIQKDITELFTPCDSGIKMMRSGIPVRDQLHEAVETYNMNALGISAGTFVFQDNLNNYNDMYEFCYNSVKEYAMYLHYPEQAIFDFMIQEYKLIITCIDIPIYSPHPTDTVHASTAKIIHAYGQPKFWNGLENKQWNENYKTWIEMGGISYKKPWIIKRINKKCYKIIRH